VDVNRRFVLRLNRIGVCFSVRLLVQQMAEIYKRSGKVERGSAEISA
jgi:hypothetical protein